MIMFERRPKFSWVLLIWLLFGISACGTTGTRGTPENYDHLARFDRAAEVVFKDYVDPVSAQRLTDWSFDGVKRYFSTAGLNRDEAGRNSSGGTPFGENVEKSHDLKDVQSNFRALYSESTRNLWVFSSRDFVDAGIKGIISNLDSQCSLLSPDEFRKLKGDVSGRGIEKLGDDEDFRGAIPNKRVHAVMLRSGVGYVRIGSFNENTASNLEAALAGLEAEYGPLRGLILDLRDNRGGLLSEAIFVSDLFLERGVIVSVKGRIKRNSGEFRAYPDAVSRSYPIVVLMNRNSASGAEIVASALRENNWAIVLGEASFGKGSVQAVEEIGGGYAIKITIARYYTPNGHLIEGRGIAPDVHISEEAVGIALLAIERADSADFDDLLEAVKGVLREKGMADGS